MLFKTSHLQGTTINSLINSDNENCIKWPAGISLKDSEVRGSRIIMYPKHTIASIMTKKFTILFVRDVMKIMVPSSSGNHIHKCDAHVFKIGDVSHWLVKSYFKEKCELEFIIARDNDNWHVQHDREIVKFTVGK